MKNAIRFGLLVLLCCLFVMPLTLAKTNTTILDDWVSYDHSFTYLGDKFQIIVGNAEYSQGLDGGTLKLTKNGALVEIASYQSCETGDFYKVCFDNATYDDEDDLIRYGDGKLQPAVQVTIIAYDYGDVLNFTKTVGKSALEWGDQTRVLLRFENNGNVSLSNVELEEIIPEGFDIIKLSEGLTHEGNTLKITFNLFSNRVTEVFYYIKAKTNVTSTFVTNVNYDTAYFKNKKLKPTNLTITFVPTIVEETPTTPEETPGNDAGNTSVDDEPAGTNEDTGMIINNDVETKKVYDDNMNFFEKIIYLIKGLF